MEKRALIAFILSLVVFLGWGYVLKLVEGPQSQRVEEQVIQALKLAPSVQEAPTKPSPALQPSDQPTSPVAGTEFVGTETRVKVTTGLATYMISNKGGAITDILLQKYNGPKGDPTNLVHTVEGAKLPLTIEASDPAVSRIIQEAYYETSANSLDLTESNPTGKLTLHLKQESGFEVVRDYTFHYNQYLVDIETRLVGKPFAGRELQYMVLWGPGLGGETVSNSQMFIHTGPTTFINNERVETKAEDVSGILRQQGTLEWTALQNKYFSAVLIPGRGVKNAVVTKSDSNVYVGLDFVAVQSSASAAFSLYAGTKELQILENTGHKLVRLMDYGWLGNKFAFLVKPLLRVLRYFYSLTQNYGWSIIILTCIIKIMFFPLTHKSFKSMKGMQKIQPYVKVIQERNKNDRNKMNEELIDLYKKHRVNPLGGCLPMLLQIPVFIALYHVLFFSIELRGAPFLWWIKDLSESDPYYISPILMGATMFLQQKITPSVGDPIQQKVMMFLPVIFTFMFVSFPAGLVIYWTINNILTISQQYYIYKFTKD
ncbi:MAG: hypothetical protein A3K09_04985 [Nitrospinae bacterium RIFCSPLOWO2_12_FULL_47_7]|nr:MAG: hypothetical protein A3K09_04985 [Nitrospinae bacterium RIFCSPLOWO2_12_FULL_47_7]